jgi:pimeloyl-ACP methyl ester carboxylesterase
VSPEPPTIREPDRAGFVQLNRMRLRVWEWGDPAAPAVICAHGAQDHGRMWDDFAPRLAELGYRVLAPDIRGHGDSGPLASGLVWAASAIDFGLLSRAAGPSVGLVGHSFGAGQMMWVAAVWPELVRWVVSIDGLGPPAVAFAERDLGPSSAAALAACERSMFGSRRMYSSLDEMVERRRRANPRLPQAWLEHLVRHGAREGEGGYVWKSDPLLGADLPLAFNLEHLSAEHALLRCPLLVLTGGEHDTWSELTPEELDERLRHLPTARHHVIPGAGHYLHLERPEAVFAAVRTFLEEVGP